MGRLGLKAHPEKTKRFWKTATLCWAEKKSREDDSYTWIGYIKARVYIAKCLSHDVESFDSLCNELNLSITESKMDPHDWVFAIKNEDTHTASGARLGENFRREEIIYDLMLTSPYLSKDTGFGSRVFKRAKSDAGHEAYGDLKNLALAFREAIRFDSINIKEFDSQIDLYRQNAKERQKPADAEKDMEKANELEWAKAYLVESGILTNEEVTVAWKPQHKETEHNTHVSSSRHETSTDAEQIINIDREPPDINIGER
ncbi:MAG: hypothetical protein LUB61_07535 [Eggerthellaceae bacterium]|nr:hypothetical protein [Eggerthellaceae bacterium]